MRKWMMTAAALAAMLGSGFASAAVIEEIVVTAQKREQNLQDVGIAISALSGEQMRELGYTNAQQVTAMAPGVQTIQPNGEANYALAVRGVATSDFTTNIESPVAVYVDEVYVSQMSGTGFMLFDMDRVEILKGPQGTLYGRNATGGLAHYVTRRPSDELDGYLSMTAGSYNQFRGDGAIGGPLTDTLKARLSFAWNQHSPYIRNRIGKNLNNGNEQGLRFQLDWTPTDRMDVLLNVRGMNQHIDTGFFENVSSVIEGQLTPGVFNPVEGYVDTDGNPWAGDYDAPGSNDLETRGYSATIHYDFDDFTVTSITDYSTVKRDYIEDSDASPVPLFNFFLNTDAEQFSQEIRVSGDTDRLNWVAGIYYLDLEVNDANGAESEPFIDPASDTPAVSGLDNPYTTETQSISLFGQVEYRLNDEYTLVAGLRWIDDDKEHTYAVNAVDFIPGTRARNGNPNILANIATYRGKRNDKEVAWRFAVNKYYSEDVMAYLSYNRGVKGGGYNAPVFPLSPPLAYDDATMSYDPEQLDAYEIGIKSQLAGGLVRINAAAYYYDYKDYQAFQIIGIDTLTTNADALSRGAEIEIAAAPIDGLELLFGGAYNDIEVDLGGGRPKTTSVQSPKWNFNGLARYEFGMPWGRVALQYDAVYRSKHFFALTRLETVRESGYAVHNAAITLTHGKWRLQGFVHNLTDKEYLVQTFDLSGPNIFGMTEQYFGRPRWGGVTLTYDLND